MPADRNPPSRRADNVGHLCRQQRVFQEAQTYDQHNTSARVTAPARSTETRPLTASQESTALANHARSGESAAATLLTTRPPRLKTTRPVLESEALPKVDTHPTQPQILVGLLPAGTIIPTIQEGPVGTRIPTAMPSPQCRRPRARPRTIPPRPHQTSWAI